MDPVNVVALIWLIVIVGIILTFLFYFIAGGWALLVAIYYKLAGYFMAWRLRQR